MRGPRQVCSVFGDEIPVAQGLRKRGLSLDETRDERRILELETVAHFGLGDDFGGGRG